MSGSTGPYGPYRQPDPVAPLIDDTDSVDVMVEVRGLVSRVRHENVKTCTIHESGALRLFDADKQILAYYAPGVWLTLASVKQPGRVL